VISWDDYIASLQGQLEEFGTQDEDDVSDNEVEEELKNTTLYLYLSKYVSKYSWSAVQHRELEAIRSSCI
jgi:hypothetical protein